MPRRRLSTKNERAAGFQTPRRWNVGVNDREFDAFHWGVVAVHVLAPEGVARNDPLAPLAEPRHEGALEVEPLDRVVRGPRDQAALGGLAGAAPAGVGEGIFAGDRVPGYVSLRMFLARRRGRGGLP
jgi:hypothetical protein